MKIPQTLNDWTLEVVENLAGKGRFECDWFDFKEMLPVKGDKEKIERLYKTCCAFANSSGGFLIFGVKDDRKIPAKERIVGIDQIKEFPNEFGSYPGNCEPSIYWEPKNPAIQLANGNLIHIVHIPRSWNGPHCYTHDNEKRFFTKRTNKGTEHMSYEEIRMGFLQYYEKRLKLNLLFAELNTIQNLGIELSKANSNQLLTIDMSVLESTLVDTYIVLANSPDLLSILSKIRGLCRRLNHSVLSPGIHTTESRMSNIKQLAQQISDASGEAITLVETIITS